MNKIAAITVSKNYADLLEHCIKYNHEIFDKWYIATQEDDTATIELVKDLNLPNVKLFYYPLVPDISKPDHAQISFSEEGNKVIYDIGGARLIPADKLKTIQPIKRKDNWVRYNKILFDKGGAVRHLQNQISLNENVLVLDSDILIPEAMKHDMLNYELEQDAIYGCHRIDFPTVDEAINNDRSKAKDYHRNNCLDGFFQLYINNNIRKYYRSFNASGCDVNFVHQFPKKYIFRQYVHHIGWTAKNWNGRKT
jgi:hypothetical protein